ncbi:MAG: ABC transporter ATP-binding protein [bacterium]|nr:ABC transporter ATP-binding protein [bacterium]MDZ4299789.1 ABC transporter ATP-binding protein [Candidatus Sungbacteria bacterium]
MLLRVNELTKKFGEVPAVNGVSFGVEAGEIFALIGPNGSGKTTMVKTIAGLLRQNAGSILVNGHDTLNDPLNAKQSVGYIPDDPTIWSGMTGEEFLHFVGTLYGMGEQVRMRRIREVLPLFSLEGLEKGLFEDYSRGNKQKFSILAGLMHEPKLLLIDEPIVGLDPASTEIAKRAFVRFAEGGGAIMLVTHTLSVAEEIASRIGVLREGVLVATGSLAELRARKNLPADSSLHEIYKHYTGT